MPRPRSLTEAGIARAALDVLDREGTGALSMRAVGRELGVGAMSLYRYVENRERLEELIVDHVLSGVDTDVPDDAPWTAKVAALVERVRDAIGDHPAVVPLVLTHRHSSPGSLGWIEAMLAALAEGGFDGAQRAIAQRTLVSYLIGATQLAHFSALSGPGTTALSRLPETHPLVASTAAAARQLAPADEFRQGLEAVLAGLAARAQLDDHPTT